MNDSAIRWEEEIKQKRSKLLTFEEYQKQAEELINREFDISDRSTLLILVEETFKLLDEGRDVDISGDLFDEIWSDCLHQGWRGTITVPKELGAALETLAAHEDYRIKATKMLIRIMQTLVDEEFDQHVKVHCRDAYADLLERRDCIRLGIPYSYD
jgi:hypothetical protein